MSIYLVQHGVCHPKDVDPEKGLSGEGFGTVNIIAALAAEKGIEVSKIYNSGKKRASQTATIFADHLNPENGVSKLDGINPLDDVS